MKTIVSNANTEVVINKSRFIGFIYFVNSKEEVTTILDKLKNEYYDASHICYAYILENIEKMSDDGEPSKTAGTPIIDVLKKNNLKFVLGVVIRYFGGIKLGSGGLIRAYSNTIRDTISKTTLKELEKGYLIKLLFNYNNESLINNLIEKNDIISKEYQEEIIYTIKCNNDILNKLESLNLQYEIIKEIYL